MTLYGCFGSHSVSAAIYWKVEVRKPLNEFRAYVAAEHIKYFLCNRLQKRKGLKSNTQNKVKLMHALWGGVDHSGCDQFI